MRIVAGVLEPHQQRGQVHAAEGRISDRSFNKGKQFVFEIGDTGIGIEPRTSSQNFRAVPSRRAFHYQTIRWARSRPNDFGKTLLDLHGGTISVESAGKDQGTTFRIFLDALRKPVKAAAEKVSKSVTAPKSLRLLLVDDHADTRAVLQATSDQIRT